MPRHVPLVLARILVLAAVLAAVPAHAPRTAAAAGLSASPSSLSVILPLGAADTRTIAITNSTNAPVTPSVLEAEPAYKPAQSVPVAGPRHVTLPAQAGRLDPELTRALQSPGQRADFIVYLHDQADLSAAYAVRDWDARGRYVYDTLRAQAKQTQANVLAELEARGVVARPLWIVNALAVRGTLADAQALAGRGDVALVRANHIHALPTVEPAAAATGDLCSPDAPSNTVCWNVRQIGADRVWRDFGVAGRGIVVANIDTGVRFDHPALLAQYRGYRAGQAPDHNYNWFDPKLLVFAPNDQNGHGTHTMGTMVAAGKGSATQPAVGVAPGARWIAAQGCASVACSDLDLIDSAQWMLAPTALNGTNPRPDLRPMIINNSWADTGGNDWYAGYVAAWRAAGIFPVFAAGNTGSACGSINSPGDYADVFGVGATDERDIATWFSARGPTVDGRHKPDVVAPGGGEGILSTSNGDGLDYRTLQGTSMAAPLVAGTVALMWSANPSLLGDYERTVALIKGSARPLRDDSCGDGQQVPNNVYGYGRVDAYAAVQRARVDVPWLSVSALPGQLVPGASGNVQLRFDASRVPGPGTYQARVELFATLTTLPQSVDITFSVGAASGQAVLSGRVVADDTGAPVAAQVSVAGGQAVDTDADGNFTLVVAPGSFQLRVSAPSFLPYQRATSLAGDARLPDVRLRPGYPELALAHPSLDLALNFAQTRSVTITLANNGPQPLEYSARVLPGSFAVQRSDAPGGPDYQWIDLPSSARQIVLRGKPYSDTVSLGFPFPFYGSTYTETLAAADGFLSFSLPIGEYIKPVTGCFPDTAFLYREIAPFRTDIDLARGGAIRYATTNGRRAFVISYENVRLAGSAPETYSFQVILHDDGRIVYQYRDIPLLPDSVAVGVQQTTLDYQSIGCGSAAPIAAGLAIELRPQYEPAAWLALSEEGGTVPANGRHAMRATVHWVYPGPLPQQARIELRSSDPLRRIVLLPLTLDARPASNARWMPMINRPWE